jgi:hypothetical protein
MNSETSAVLDLNDTWQNAPSALVLHLPWFMQTQSATADGVALKIDDDSLLLPVNVREVKLQWRRRPSSSRMSYEKTVAGYKQEYRRRYEHLLSTGEMSPAVDTWHVPEH